MSRIDRRTKLRPILLANEAAAEGQQGNEWSNSVHIHQQPHGRHAG